MRANLGGRAASSFLARLAFSVLPSIDKEEDEQTAPPRLTSAQVLLTVLPTHSNALLSSRKVTGIAQFW